MRIIEENLLKDITLQLNQYSNIYNNLSEFYDGLSGLNIESVQKESFQKDLEFFDELSLILSVISSIIARPHISNKGEDVILRGDQAQNISNESFQKTLRDSSLWKEKNLEMVPEYVHHFEINDEIKIYENVFVGMIIKLIDNELKKYSEFYSSLLPTVDYTKIIPINRNEYVEEAIRKIDVMIRKVSHLKNTYFYKEVSKVTLPPEKIQPTNILVKNRLYNMCYKFYRKFIRYDDQAEVAKDLRMYYYYLILKVFEKNDFILDKGKSKDINNISLKNKDFLVDLTNHEEEGIILKISLKNDPEIKATHVLYTNHDKKLSERFVKNKKAISNYVISIWNLIDLNNNQSVFKSLKSEERLVEYWVDSKFQETPAKIEVYSRYCPSCKSKDLEEDGKLIHCQNCHTVYIFKPNRKVIWFVDLRG